MQTPEEPSHELDANRYIFSLAPDTDAEKSWVFFM